MRIIMVELVLVSVIRCAANSLEVFARVLARDLRSRSSLELTLEIFARGLRSRSSLEVFARGLRSRSSLEVFARGLRSIFVQTKALKAELSTVQSLMGHFN